MDSWETPKLGIVLSRWDDAPAPYRVPPALCPPDPPTPPLQQLERSLQNFGQPWELSPGDGAFYGPKVRPFGEGGSPKGTNQDPSGTSPPSPLLPTDRYPDPGCSGAAASVWHHPAGFPDAREIPAGICQVLGGGQDQDRRAELGICGGQDWAGVQDWCGRIRTWAGGAGLGLRNVKSGRVELGVGRGIRIGLEEQKRG